MNKLKEVTTEFKEVVLGRSPIVEIILPPLLFLLVNLWLGFEAAIAVALLTAVFLAVRRLVRREPIWGALGGVAGVLLAIGISRLSGNEAGFFLPTILSGWGTAVIAIGSIIAKRPMVAWTSRLTRRWPWAWYWHPRVRPAYSETTWLWGLFFAGRALLQYRFFDVADTATLAWLNLITGWPAIILLLVVTYLYGTWRLRQLKGPSVAEYLADAAPPWEGQQKGF